MVLPCGREPVDVWDHAAAGLADGHEQTCPYCQEVIEQYRTTADPISRWQAQPVSAPPALLERVLATVRSGLRSRNHLPLPSPRGPVNLDTVAAQAALRWSLDQHLDVRAQQCTVTTRPLDIEEQAPDDGAPPPRTVVDIDLSLSAPIGSDLRAVAGQARTLLRTVATERLSLDVADVNVHVADLYDGAVGPADDDRADEER